MSQEQNVAAQQHLAGSINDGNVNAGVETFAEDSVDHDPAPGQGPGREGFRDFWNTITNAFPDAHIEPRHEVVDDEHVVVAYTLTGTHEGEFEGIAPDREEDQHQRHPDRPLRERADRGALGLERRARDHEAAGRGAQHRLTARAGPC